MTTNDDEHFQRLSQKYHKFLQYEREEGNEYDESVDKYEESLRRDFGELTPEQRTDLFEQALENVRSELDDCLVENHTLRALELMILEQLLKQVIHS